MITDPEDINAAITSPGEVRLPRTSEIMEATAAECGGECYDFAAFYNGFGISDEMGEYYGFLWKGKAYCLRVIPTGQRHCPALAQSLTASIVDSIVEELATAGIHIHGSAYIDNVRFMGAEEDVARAREKLQRVCSDLGIHLNIESTWSTEYTFLGMHFQHKTAATSSAEVTLGAKTIGKIQTWSERLIEESNNSRNIWTMREVVACFGLLMWGAQILAIPMHDYYYIFKFLRRRSHLDIDTPTPIWRCVHECLFDLAERCLSNDPRKIVPGGTNDDDEPQVICFTDSCLSGWGVLIFVSGEGLQQQIYTFCGKWNSVEDIQVLEARALLQLAKILPSQTETTRLRVYIDNTSVEGAWRKGRSANFFVNNVIAQVIHLFEAKRFQVELLWCSTVDNLADGASRIHEPRK